MLFLIYMKDRNIIFDSFEKSREDNFNVTEKVDMEKTVIELRRKKG